MDNDKYLFTQQLLNGALLELNDYNYIKSIDLLRKVAVCIENSGRLKELDDVENHYFYMLNYLKTHSLSSNAEEINSVKVKIKNISDKLHRDLIMVEDSPYGAQLRFEKLRPEENLQSIISDYLSEAARLRTDPATFTDSAVRAGLERLSTDIFNRLWTIYNIDEDTATLLADIISDKSISSTDRELWVNALGFSLTYYNDYRVFDILKLTAKSEEQRLRIAASVWLAITSAASDDYNSITFNDENSISYEIFRSLADCLTEVENDLFRDMSAIGTRLNGIDLTNLDAIKNIDLSTEDYEKIKRFNEAQASGADVFGKSIGRMRHYPFFATLANWFLPFDPFHSSLAGITNGEGAEIAETIAAIPNIADSDKYAMLLSMANLPAEMRNQVLTSIVDGMRSISDTPEFRDAMDGLSKPHDNIIISNQIHQLSRFLNTHPDRTKFPLSRLWTIENMFTPSKMTAVGMNTDNFFGLGKLLYKRGQAKIAAELIDFSAHDIEIEDLSTEDLELLGDTGNMAFDDISRNFHRASAAYGEILNRDPKRIDIAIKLSHLYILTGLPEQGLDVLNRIETDNKDTSLLICMAECYTALGKFDEAINTLLQADYNSSEENFDIKIRQIDLYIKNAQPYEAYQALAQLPEHTKEQLAPGLQGIVMWLCGDSEEALASWKAKLKNDEQSNDFLKELRKTISSLSKYPIGQSDGYAGLCVAPDILTYQVNGSKFGNI